jgi:RNA polymerase sigma-70 factor (sigma-E family)
MEFDEFVRHRGEALVRLGRMLTGDRQLGEDVTQEVLTRAFLRWRRIAGLDLPEAYVRRMLVNAAIRQRRRPAGREVLRAEPEETAAPGHHGTDAAERDALWRLVRQLPAKQRAAVVLRYYEDLDDVAIGNLLDCKPVTVRTQIMRALDNLRPQLAADYTVDRSAR